MDNQEVIKIFSQLNKYQAVVFVAASKKPTKGEAIATIGEAVSPIKINGTKAKAKIAEMAIAFGKFVSAQREKKEAAKRQYKKHIERIARKHNIDKELIGIGVTAPIAHRLAKFKKKKFIKITDFGYRTNYRFEQAPVLNFVSNDKGASFSQSDYLDWNYYSKGCKYAKKIVNTELNLKNNWFSEVAARGIALVEYRLVIDVLEELSDNLLKVAYLKQGRGYAITQEIGVINLETMKFVE